MLILRVQGDMQARCVVMLMWCVLQPYHQQYLAKGGRNGQAQDPSKGCKGGCGAGALAETAAAAHSDI
jgi:hypothetical protein